MIDVGVVRRKSLRKKKPPTQCGECFEAGLTLQQSVQLCPRCKPASSRRGKRK